MKWEVEYKDEFGQWWSGLTEEERVSLGCISPTVRRTWSQFGFSTQQWNQWLQAQTNARA